MYGLDNTSGVPTMPPTTSKTSEISLWFTSGAVGQSPSYPGHEWFNIIQAELLNLLHESGIKPDKNQLTQVAQAVQKMISNNDQFLKKSGGTLTGELTVPKINLADKNNPSGTALLADGNILGGVWGAEGNARLYVDTVRDNFKTHLSALRDELRAYVDSTTIVVTGDGYTQAFFKSGYAISEGVAEVTFTNGVALFHLPVAFSGTRYTFIPIDIGNAAVIYYYASRPVSKGVVEIRVSQGGKISGTGKFGFRWLAMGLCEE